MNKKKYRKCFISSKGIKKADFQKALALKYNIIYTDCIEDADFFVAPFDTSGLNDEQKRDLEKAASLGIETKLIDSKFLLSDQEDPLDLDYKNQPVKNLDHEDDFDRELELF